MNSEQEKKLLDYLATLGFEGEKFTASLQEKLRLNTPNFTVTYRQPFGEELMLFKLYFANDLQFDAYRLQKYHAIHRSPVITEHLTINGVDTEALEARMKVLDWDLYFDSRKEASHPEEIKEMREVNNLLNKLAEGQNFDGIEIQEELIYKYWPADSYTSNDKHDFKFYHERGRDFSVTEYGTCNINLTYHIVSGRLDGLHEKLQYSGLEQWPGEDVHGKLCQILSRNPEDFKLEFTRNEPEGYAEITIPVIPEADEFIVETYTMTVTPHPPIDHEFYNGIDSKQLEDQMREIDWNNDRQLFVFQEDKDAEPEFQPKVAAIQEQIYRLSQDMAGAEIADQLMVKYWSGATFFEDMVSQEGWDYLDSLPKFTQEFPADFNAKAGYNLLCGRAIPDKMLYPFLPESDQWIRLDLEEKNANGNYAPITIDGMNQAELERIINILPIPNSNFYPVRNGLLRGDLVPATLDNGRKIVMEANPEGRTINVYTPDMRLIPTNFHLDPDWKPQHTPAEQAVETKSAKQLPAPKKAPAKRKGRGL